MNTARALLEAKLEAVLPGTVRLRPHALDVRQLDEPTVMVRIDTVTPSTQPQAWRQYAATLTVAVPYAEPGPADDDLDELLEVVLDALDASDLPAWTAATRAVLADGEDTPRWPAYQVALTIATTPDPPNA